MKAVRKKRVRVCQSALVVTTCIAIVIGIGMIAALLIDLRNEYTYSGYDTVTIVGEGEVDLYCGGGMGAGSDRVGLDTYHLLRGGVRGSEEAPSEDKLYPDTQSE